MDIPKIHEGEYRFCLIMWEHEPVTAAELVKLCQEQLGWKRCCFANKLRKIFIQSAKKKRRLKGF